MPVDNNPSSVEKNMRLTEEQRQVLIQMEKEQKAAEEAKKLEAQRKEQEAANAEKAAAQAQQAQPAQTDQAQSTQPQQTAKTEVKKPEPVKKTEPVKKPEPPKKVEVVKAEPAKTEQPKKAEPKPAEQQVQTSGKKFGLQCGAFKNRAQAESLQGRLAIAGVNAQIATSEEWNRVRVGPFGSRDAATAAQDKAKSVASCVVIGM